MTQLDFTLDNYIFQIKKLQIDAWKQLSQLEKEQTLQWIADYKAYELGLPSLCNVLIVDMQDKSKRGIFINDSHDLLLSKDLVDRCLRPPYKPHNENRLAGNETFETLMHEFFHAVQQYVKENPEIKAEGYDFNLIAINCNTNNALFKSYFDMNKLPSASILYHIQPVERQAFTFANLEYAKWTQLMKKEFPEDNAFLLSIPFSKFDKNVILAKEIFQTETPFEDIDDIIKLINGISNERPINKLMMDAVFDTQMKSTIQAQWFKLQCKNNKDVMLQKLIDNVHKNYCEIQQSQHNNTEQYYDPNFEGREM